MNDRGMNKTILLVWRDHNNDQVVHAPIMYVAGAVTDTDDTYGAYVAAEKIILLIIRILVIRISIVIRIKGMPNNL